MKKILVRILAIMLMLTMLVLPLTSCANDGDTEETESGTVSTVDDDSEYKYFPEGADFGEKEFYVLNCEREQWNYIAMFTSHEYLGSTINDAFYARTMWIEETLNCKLVEVNIPMIELMTTFDRDVNTGDSEYDAAFLPAGGGNEGSFMTQAMAGTLKQLDDVETLHLENDYYVEFVMRNMSIKNRHYTAASDAQLAYFEGAWVLYFNVEILTERQIDLPYEYVKNGTWTLEVLEQMAIQAATPEDDGSYEFISGGSAIYGISGHPAMPGALLYGINAPIAAKNADDFLVLNVDTEGFTNRALEIGSLMATSGVVYQCRPGHEEEDPTEMILDQRSAFVASEIFEMKDAIEGGVDIGVTPYPKYNDDQENYMTTANYNGNYFVIPITNPNPEEIGLIYDAMAWEAKKTFEQAYFVDHLELKMNSGEMEDDIEMLRIIRETMNGDPALFTGLGVDLRKAVQDSMLGGAGTLSSDIASSKTKVQKLLDTLDKVIK